MAKVAVRKGSVTIVISDIVLAEHVALGWEVVSVSNDLSNSDIVIGDQAVDTINVAIQLQDENGAALEEPISLQAFLSDAADGLAKTAGVPDGHVAIGTEGGCIHLVTDAVFLLNTNSSGLVDIDLTESGAATWYLVLIFPNGERVVSGAIIFA